MGVKVLLVTQPILPGRPGGNLESQILDVVERSSLAKIVRQRRAVAPRFVGAAGEAAFAGTWVNFDAAAAPVGRQASYFKQAGIVRLTGVIKSGTAGTAAFVLPADCLPYWTVQALAFPVFASGGIATLQINADGSVIPVNVGATSVAAFVFLDGVSFLAR